MLYVSTGEDSGASLPAYRLAFSGNRLHTANQPVTTKVLWTACRRAAERAGLEHQYIHAHTLRLCVATHRLEAGADLRPIQMLPGHRDLIRPYDLSGQISAERHLD
jgi:integrase